MALGDPYATLDEFKAYLSLDDSRDDGELEDALNAASRQIEGWCSRQFNNTTIAVPQLYRPCDGLMVKVSDFYSTDDLVIETDTAGDGTFATEWADDDYVLEPVNGIVGGKYGWPYNLVIAVGAHAFPTLGPRAGLKVTAKYGWAAVPAPVKQACLITASELFKLKGAPFGVAGMGEYGQIRVREVPSKVGPLLAPYRLSQVLVA